MMIGHYLSSALAKFRKAPFTTGANVLTLALGLACFIAAYGIAVYLWSGDAYHANADRIFVVGESITLRGETTNPVGPGTTPTLARYLEADAPAAERIARVMAQPDLATVAGSAKLILNGAIVDPGFLTIFDLDFIEGDPRTALTEPDTIVLTEAAARRLFGEAPALGQSVTLGGEDEVTVAGVVGTVRQPSFMGDGPDAVLRFDLLRHWASSQVGAAFDVMENWQATNAMTFVTLEQNTSVEAFNRQLESLVDLRIPGELREAADIVVEAFPVSELSIRRLDRMLFAGNASVSTVGVLLTLGALILTVACVNYANLAAAQTLTRMKEVGVRKALGSGRLQTVVQVWLETAVLTFAAAVVAAFILIMVREPVRSWASLDILHAFSQGVPSIAVAAGLVASVSLVAAFYPALIQSGVQPVVALRSGHARSGPKAVASILVSLQFASASFLLILISVTLLQRSYLERTALGPREDPIVILNDLMPLDVDFETLAARLQRSAAIESVSVVDKAPWNLNGSAAVPFATSPEAGATPRVAYVKTIGYDYFATMNQAIVAGRDFDRVRDTRPAPTYFFTTEAGQEFSVVIDEAYAERLGFTTPQDAVGQIIYVPAAATNVAYAQPARIIGVAESDMTRLETLSATGITGIEGNVYTFATRAVFGGQHPVIRLNGDNVSRGITAITDAWDDLAPTTPVNIRFFDQLFELNYRNYARISQLFMVLAGTAFIIASLGLVGIAVHVTARRRHEVGVRKTLGATTGRVLRMLVADFSKPVVIGNIIAWPFAWMAAQTYLQSFAERTPLTPVPFILSLIVTLLIAWASVGGQAWKAARVKPALVLKAE